VQHNHEVALIFCLRCLEINEMTQTGGINFALAKDQGESGNWGTAGNVISINIIFDNCVCREALMEL